MAAKRFFDESGNDSDEHQANSEKRTRRRPSFASVIGQVLMVNTLENFFSSLEPMLRRVVSEEVDQGLKRCVRSFTRSPSLKIQSLEPSTLKLVFGKKLSLPIFTGTKIGDIDNNPLQILLVDTSREQQMISTILPHSIKIEIVVLDGDFPLEDCDTWTSEEFNRKIVKERTGKRPLLTGSELVLTMRDGYVAVGDIEFTDNSSWIRSRKFRIGARVVPGSNFRGVRIGEGMTEAFVVKDHRGELYKKHHPPILEDEVWRLEKIGKDGAFHKKLALQSINTVQDFLKLSVVDPTKLRRILGIGMSDKTWEVTMKHARTCVMGNKYRILRADNFAIVLNPICQVTKAIINGEIFSSRDLTNLNKAYIENLVRQAYTNWHSLVEVDGLMSETTAFLTQGDQVEQYANTHHHQQATIIRPVQQQETGYLSSSSHMAKSDWLEHATSTSYLNGPPMIQNGTSYNFSESSSDGVI